MIIRYLFKKAAYFTLVGANDVSERNNSMVKVFSSGRRVEECCHLIGGICDFFLQKVFSVFLNLSFLVRRCFRFFLLKNCKLNFPVFINYFRENSNLHIFWRFWRAQDCPSDRLPIGTSRSWTWLSPLRRLVPVSKRVPCTHLKHERHC